MFDISGGENGVIEFSGRLDTAQAERARSYTDSHSQVSTFDFATLDYISSAGLGVLLVVHKRLMRSGGTLRLININNHIRDVFRYSGFDKLLDIEPADS